MNLLSFNPLPHAEGDRLRNPESSVNGVSIHSLTQRETWDGTTFSMCMSLFQSTPSRRGRRPGGAAGRSGSGVSIHSLTQRETLHHDKKYLEKMFQSTPSRRGRRPHSLQERTEVSFNPLPHAEGDTYGSISPICRIHVSIHSLTQRETPTFTARKNGSEFQSPPSRRGRHLRKYNYNRQNTRFNPLPHAEGDSFTPP